MVPYCQPHENSAIFSVDFQDLAVIFADISSCAILRQPDLADESRLVEYSRTPDKVRFLMRARIIVAIALLVVGLGAVAFVLFPPGSAPKSSQLLTAQASVTDVVSSATATGNLASAHVYSLSFGQAAQLSSASSTSSSSSSSATGSGGLTWPVKTVLVTVGQAVKAGDTLASADDSAANLALTIALANLSTASARLATDQTGLNATDKAAAKLSITSAEQQLANARQNRTDNAAANALSVSQAVTSLTKAKSTLAADEAAAGTPAAVIDADKAAVTAASAQLASARLKATQSDHQSTQAIASATLGVTSAKNAYATKTAPATTAVIDADKAAVASATATVADAKATVAKATLVAPADGIVTGVNIVTGFPAPSGAAITLASADMVITGNFTESDIINLADKQVASITVNALGRAFSGVVSSVSATAATSGSGSVVTYPVVIAFDSPDPSLRSGMSASISITIAQATNVLSVPSVALVGTSGNYQVRRVAADGTASLVPVSVGLVTSSLAEIQSGLSVGDTVQIGTSSSQTGTSGSNRNNFGGGTFNGGGPGGGVVVP
jgi:HlyD family secretion protein